MHQRQKTSRRPRPAPGRTQTPRRTRPARPAGHARPTAGELARSLLALTALAAFLLAVPAGLWTWRHNPLPGSVEPARWWDLAVAGYLHPDVLPNTLATAAWLTWAWFTLCLLWEATALATRPRTTRRPAPPGSATASTDGARPSETSDGTRTAPRATTGRAAPAPRAVRRAAASWVATAAVVLTLASSRAALAAPTLGPPAPAPAPTAVPVAAVVVAPTATTPDYDTAPTGLRQEQAVDVETGSPAGDLGDHAGGLYRCGPYDTLRSLAQEHLGDPDRWTDIQTASTGTPQPDGTHLPPDFVVVTDGTLLVLPTTTTTTGTPTVAFEPVTGSHVVAPGESLWTITADAYPTATEADLPHLVDTVYTTNQGTTDPTGRTLHDPGLVNPGMHLTLPTVDTTETPTPPTAPAPDTDPPAGEEVRPAPSSEPPTGLGGLPPTAPPTTAPGWTPTPPPQPAPALPPAPVPNTPTSPAPAPTDARQPADDAPDDTSRHDAPDLAPAWVGGAGALLTTAVVLTVAHRRRRRDHTAGRDRQVPPPAPEAATLHTAVLAAATTTGTARLDAALRDLAAQHLRQTPADGPVPQVVLVRPDRTLDVYLRQPLPDPPAPWTADADGRIWVLAPDADIPVPPDMAPPCPTLVQLGLTPDGAELYTDLEALGVLAVDAADHGPAGLKALARAVLATLALSPLAGDPQILTSGFDPLGLADDTRVEPTDALDKLLHQADRHIRQTTHDLTSQQQTSTFAARATAPDDNWEPLAALLTNDLDRIDEYDFQNLADLTRLAELGGQGLTVLLPAHPDVDTPWTLTLISADPPRWRLDPLGLAVTPTGLAADELADLCALLDDASAPPVPIPAQPAEPAPPPWLPPQPATPGPPPTRPPAPAGPLAADTAVTSKDTFVEPEWAVMVRLLGPLDVVGPDGAPPPDKLATPRVVEVLAWLATHRRRTRTDLEAALWPTGVQARTLNNQLGYARRLLVTLAGDHARQWIPTHRTLLDLDRKVVTDADLFTARLRHAERHHDQPDIAVPTLTAALDLVRGTPANRPWIDAELGSTLTTTIARAALHLADHHLAAGNHQAVLDVTARGLAILPSHPALFALRMRAHAAAGDRKAVKTEYHAYLRAEQADPLWDGDTDRDLETLHNQLTRPGPRRAPTEKP